MSTIINLCFLCTKDNNCVPVNKKIVKQVKYLLPEITIIKLGVPLRICPICDGALCAFSKFKQSSLESSRLLESRIKGAQGPPLHTGSPPVVGDNESLVSKPEKIEEIFIVEEYLEETPLDTQMHTNRKFLNPMALVETIISEPQNQLHKDRVSQNMQLHTDTNTGKIEEVFIKQEQIEETTQDREYFNTLKEECESNLLNDDTDNQPEHNTEEEEVWEETIVDTEEETDGNFIKNVQIGPKKITHKPKKQIQENIGHRCNVCSVLFISKDFLTRHIKEKHSRIKDLPCKVCKKIFFRRYDLNKHMDVHHGVKNFRCPICKKRFLNKDNFEKHVKLHSVPRKIAPKTEINSDVKDSQSSDNNVEKIKKINLQCKMCDKTFKQKYNLTRHMKMHFDIKDFHCEICGKSFKQKSALNTHMTIHSGVKDFQCDICGKAFNRNDYLVSHMRVHIVNLVKCEVCGKSFRHKENLTKHMKIHVGVKDFVCEICDRSFLMKGSLTTHMKLHFGKKDFHCNLCDKSFTHKYSLIYHRKLHSGIKDFLCEICDKSFTQKSNLKSHMKTHFKT